MTKNGHSAPYFAFPRYRRHRVPLFLRRSRRRVRLHRGDDAVRPRNHNHPPNRAGFEHSRCDHRVVSVLASRTFLMEIILAIRAPLSSGCLLRWLSPVTSWNFENHYRTRAALLRRPIVFSSRRSCSRPPTLACRARGWFRYQISLWSNRDRRRDFSYTSFTFFQLGENKTGVGRLCVVYFGKFNFGPSRVSQRQAIHSSIGSHSFRRRNHRRRDWF